MSANKKLIVVDPALQTNSGHHAAFAHMLFRDQISCDEWQLEIVSHADVTEDLSRQLACSGVKIRKEFWINFYEHYTSKPSIGDVLPFLLEMSQQFEGVIRRSVEMNPQIKISFIYPSLDWVHALALSYAIDRYPDARNHLHIVCAMFNPSLSSDLSIKDVKQAYNYSFSFRRLNSIPSVRIFASCKELAVQYRHLLGKGKDIDIHPCYLYEWSSTLEDDLANRTLYKDVLPRITLYMGDAKSTKGFLDLPKFLKKICDENRIKFELFIQYTITWPSDEIVAAAKEIEMLAKKHENITLISGFLTNEEFLMEIMKTKVFLFNYDDLEYQDKNSGILWLLAWCAIPIAYFSESWISREARNLGMEYFEITKDNVVSLGLYARSASKLICADEGKRKYRSALYKNFWAWLNSII